MKYDSGSLFPQIRNTRNINLSQLRMWPVVAKQICLGYPIHCSIHMYMFDIELEYSHTHKSTYCGDMSRKSRTMNALSTFMSSIVSDPMWLDECNLSAQFSSDGNWHDFVRLSVELHSQNIFVVDVCFKLFFMNLFLLCHANKQPQIFFQQISPHTIKVG